MRHGTCKRQFENRRAGEGGFTLIEALIAMVILVVGLVAISQLMAVSAGSNSIANRGTAAAAAASQEMERLTTIPFGNLLPGGNLDANATGFFREPDIPGAGTIRTRWSIQPAGNLLFITVRSESPNLFGALTRAEFTTFRAANN